MSRFGFGGRMVSHPFLLTSGLVFVMMSEVVFQISNEYVEMMNQQFGVQKVNPIQTYHSQIALSQKNHKGNS
eukprot:3411897-Amphidinium_carterae.3